MNIIDDNTINQIRRYLLQLQNNVCNAIGAVETKDFTEDKWSYTKGKGGGITRVLEQGLSVEKGGVNFSHVHGSKLPDSLLKGRPELLDHSFQAMGVSIVIHPINPFVPTSHANVRFFIAEKENKAPVWWFGGGFDLTPYYPFKEDCAHWHQTAYDLCLPFGDDIYNKHKNWCDEYFYLPHRDENRGIGGLFFDYINHWECQRCFEYIQAVGQGYIDAYMPIFKKRKNIKFNSKHRDFQLYRRGRYVEFNLIHDRGTHFGLQSGGRTESILMSLPPLASWKYDYHPDNYDTEYELTEYYLKNRNWLDL